MDIDRLNFNLSSLTLPIIVIIGPPGAGKTEVGQSLAQDLGWQFWDTDVIIEQACNMKVTAIFSRHSEKVFRLLERKLVEEIVKLYKNHQSADGSNVGAGTVISTGGGLPVPPENFANLAAMGNLINLYASIDVLSERAGRKGNRPLLNSPDQDSQKSRLKVLFEERKGVYSQADFSIDTSGLSIEAVVANIKAKLKLSDEQS